MGTIFPGEASPSTAFFDRPRQTSPAFRYIRQEATSVASKRSVASPAWRKTRGRATPSWSEARIAAWPPAFS